MALPGPFLAGQRLTAGQLNDATQKTITSVDINTAGILVSGISTTETTIPQYTLGPITQNTGALYEIRMRSILEQTNADDEFFMFMRKNTPLTGTIIAEWNIWKPKANGAGFLFLGWADFGATADETVTYYFSLQRFSGGGNILAYGNHTSFTPTGLKITRIGYASEHTVVGP